MRPSLPLLRCCESDTPIMLLNRLDPSSLLRATQSGVSCVPVFLHSGTLAVFANGCTAMQCPSSHRLSSVVTAVGICGRPIAAGRKGLLLINAGGITNVNGPTHNANRTQAQKLAGDRKRRLHSAVHGCVWLVWPDLRTDQL